MCRFAACGAARAPPIHSRCDAAGEPPPVRPAARASTGAMRAEERAGTALHPNAQPIYNDDNLRTPVLCVNAGRHSLPAFNGLVCNSASGIGCTMQLRMRHPAAGVMVRGGILAAALISLTACHTDIAVRARTRAIADAAEAPGPPDRFLILQISIETPSAEGCRQLASALPEHAKAYGLDAEDIKCVENGSEHLAEFSSNVPLTVTPNKRGVVKAPVPEHVLFQAFVATFSHVMRARRMGTGYALTLLYNQPLFAALQADLAKQDPTQPLDLSEMRLSLDIENDLTTNEVLQISSAFVGEEPIVNSKSFLLTPRQSTIATFSNVAVADFGKRGHMTLASFYPAD